MSATGGPEAAAAPSRAARMLRTLRERPVTALILVAGVAAGVVLAFVLPIAPDDMPAWKRILGGVFLGVWLALLPLGFRLLE